MSPRLSPSKASTSAGWRTASSLIWSAGRPGAATAAAKSGAVRAAVGLAMAGGASATPTETSIAAAAAPKISLPISMPLPPPGKRGGYAILRSEARIFDEDGDRRDENAVAGAEMANLLGVHRWRSASGAHGRRHSPQQTQGRQEYREPDRGLHERVHQPGKRLDDAAVEAARQFLQVAVRGRLSLRQHDKPLDQRDQPADHSEYGCGEEQPPGEVEHAVA